jgi:hypothetical protein
MKFTKLFSALLFIALMSLLISGIFNIPFIAVAIALVAMSLFPRPAGVSFMAITKEIWTQDIVNNLYKNNDFIKRAFSADMYVLLGKVVHISVAGTPSAVKKNLTVFPQVAVKRTDVDITYAIDTFYSLPRHIEKIEQYELAYDKRQSALGEDQSQLIQTGIDSMLFRWAPIIGKIVLTDGANVVASLDDTQTRKGFTKTAFQTIKAKMDKANILNTDRIALLSSDHYNQFLQSLTIQEQTDIGRVVDLQTGLLGKYLNFDIYMRSTVLRYRGADIGTVAVVDEYDDAFVAGADDRGASLFYQAQACERALGSVEIFANPGKVEYYGDIYSMLLRLGGRIRRAEGVYAVVEELA